MRVLKGQTYVILAILFVILISLFAVFNITAVEVNYLFWRGTSPLIFVILFSVLLGGILTTVVGSKKYFSLRKENRQLRQKLTEFKAELTEDDEQQNENKEG